MDTFLTDLRFSLRLLLKSPGFAVTAILTLGLAIAANAVVFGIANSLILRPLNVPGAQNLYALEHGTNFGWQSYPTYLDLQNRNRSFESLAAFTIAQAALEAHKDTSQVWAYTTSGNYFDSLGVQPYLGRFYHASDEHGPDSAPYIVLSYGFWENYFNSDASVVGRVVRLSKHPFTIIGVAPAGFRGTLLFFSAELFVPMVNQPMLDGENKLNSRSARWIMQVFGKVKPGVATTQAAADLNSIGAYLQQNYPEQEGGQKSYTLARPTLYGDAMGGPVRGFVAALMVLAGLILLAACANLGGLFSSRAADRSRELALRMALGSGRGRILRQLLTEAVAIAIPGGFAGIVVASFVLRALSAWQPVPRYPMNLPVDADIKVNLMTLALAIVSGLLFGLLSTHQVLRTNPYEIVKSGARTTGVRHFSMRDILLGLQIAVCALLVTTSIVAVRGLKNSLDSNFGFQPRNAMLVDTDLRMAGYKGEQTIQMQKRMIETFKTLPGVQAAGIINFPPLGMGGDRSLVYDDRASELKAANSLGYSMLYRVSPEYFDAAKTTLLSGRGFTWHDSEKTQRVAIVNRTFAMKVLGSETGAVGKYFKMPDGVRVQVVGLAADGKYLLLTEQPQPAMFVPLLQSPSSQTYLVVRHNMDPQQLAVSLRGALRQLDPGLPFSIQSWEEALRGALFPSRVATVSLGVLGLMCIMLSIAGVFGLAANSVAKRRRELGIRCAIGAQPLQVLRVALGRAFKVLAIGSAIGLTLAMLATRLLAALVYQPNTRDPLVLSAVVIAMLVIGLLATWIPSQRALSLNPIDVLRED